VENLAPDAFDVIEQSAPAAPRISKPWLRCGHCGGMLVRAPRRVFERWFVLSRWRPMRCRDCGRRRLHAVKVR